MNNKSFTLIELLVVIVIIGILAGVIVVSTSSNITKAQDTKLTSVILGLNKALKIYSIESFPIETTACNIKTSCTNLKSKIDIPSIDQDIYYKTSPSGNFFVIYVNKPSNTNLSFEINSDVEDVKEVPSFTNLIAYYPLSIGTSSGTTIADMSSNANNGTMVNGPTFAEGINGNMNTGMKFDGVDDYVEHTSITFDDLSPYSFSVWVKWGTSIPNGYIIPFGNRSSSSSSIYFTNGSSKYFLYRASGVSGETILGSNTTVLFDNNWHNVVWVVDSSRNVSFYIDSIKNGDIKTLATPSAIIAEH